MGFPISIAGVQEDFKLIPSGALSGKGLTSHLIRNLCVRNDLLT